MSVDRQRYALGILTLAVQAASPPGPSEMFEKPRQRAHRLLAIDGPSYGLGRADKELLLGLTNSLANNPGDFRRLREVLG